MKIRALFLCAFLLFGILSGCASKAPSPSPVAPSATPADLIPPESPSPTPAQIKNPEKMTLGERFSPPGGFTADSPAEGSFGAYLQGLTLRADGSAPRDHDGSPVSSSPYEAVISWDAINKHTKNTAAFLRLRSEYLFEQDRGDEISFHFVSGFLFSFSKWAEGYRVNVSGNKVEWALTGKPDSSREQLVKYLATLYVYTNAASIKNDLNEAGELEIGDVLLENNGAIVAGIARGGGEVAVMLMKGGSTAQEPYILQNTGDEGSPWFVVSDGGMIYTPEGNYNVSAAKRFK